VASDGRECRCISLIGMLHYIHATSQTVPVASTLEFSKLLAPFIAPINLQHVESHSLAQWSALSNGNIVSLLDTETRRNMSSEILMTFFVPIILLHVMEVITTIIRKIPFWIGGTE
jgi:hypothetical protein